MARLRIIILSRQDDDYNVAYWADVPAARQSFYADANKTSAWKDATAEDLTALRNGSVVEQLEQQRLTSGTGLAQMEAFLEQKWTSFQNRINSSNPWQRYGSTWDGTTWTVKNNG